MCFCPLSVYKRSKLSQLWLMFCSKKLPPSPCVALLLPPSAQRLKSSSSRGMFCSSDLTPSLCVALLLPASAQKIKIVIFKEHVLFRICFLCGYVWPFSPPSAQNIKTLAARYNVLFKNLPLIMMCGAVFSLLIQKTKNEYVDCNVLFKIIIKHIYICLLRFRLFATPRYDSPRRMFCSENEFEQLHARRASFSSICKSKGSGSRTCLFLFLTTD